MKIENMLVKFRVTLKMKQYELAKELGVSQGVLSKWERGTQKPSPYMQEKIEEWAREADLLE
jgi:DNA-binding transcriptional regulator YiaG